MQKEKQVQWLAQSWGGGGLTKKGRTRATGQRTAADLQAQPGVATSGQLGGVGVGQGGKEGVSPMGSEGYPSKRPSPFPWRGEKLILLRRCLSYCLVLFSSQIVSLSEIILFICFRVQHLHTRSPSFFSAYLAR